MVKWNYKVYFVQNISLVQKPTRMAQWWACLTHGLVGLSSIPGCGKVIFGIFLLLTSEACEKSSQWLWKESCVSTGVRMPGNTCASLTTMWPSTLYQIDKILDWPKLQVFADDNLNVAKMMISFYDRVENMMGKAGNTGYQHFLLFPQVDSKGFFHRVVKSRDCVVKN